MIAEIFRPQSHEIAIREHFGPLASYDGGQVFRVPLYLLGFSNRSGSNLMAQYLYDTGAFALFNENLNSDIVINAAKSSELSGFPTIIRYWVEAMISTGRIPGFKANWAQVVMLHRLGITRMFPAVHMINIVRNDLLGQAISFSIASQTHQWLSTQTAKREPEFCFDDIANRLFGTNFANFAMDIVSLVLELKSVTVFYEDLERNPKSVIEQVVKAFDLGEIELADTMTTIQRQRENVNEIMREKFAAQFREMLIR